VADLRRWDAAILWAFVIFLAIAYYMFVTTPEADGTLRTHQVDMGFAAFLGLCALPLIVGGIAGACNRAIITADKDMLTRTTRPIGRTVVIDAGGIRQFFIGRNATQTTLAQGLFVLDAQDHVHRLMAAFPSTIASHQICHELQDFYGLEDLPVFGQTDHPDHPGPRRPGGDS